MAGHWPRSKGWEGSGRCSSPRAWPSCVQHCAGGSARKADPRQPPGLGRAASSVVDSGQLTPASISVGSKRWLSSLAARYYYPCKRFLLGSGQPDAPPLWRGIAALDPRQKTGCQPDGPSVQRNTAIESLLVFYSYPNFASKSSVDWTSPKVTRNLPSV